MFSPFVVLRTLILIVRGLIGIYYWPLWLDAEYKMGTTYSEKEKSYLLKVGDKIRQLRTDIGLSQEKLSFACDLDRTYIGSVERGERNISVINLQKIAIALDTVPSELLKF